MRIFSFMFALVALLPLSLAQSDTVADCSAVTDCLGCLEGGCFWTTDNQCLGNCTDIVEPHVGCYYPWAISSSSIAIVFNETTGENMTVTEGYSFEATPELLCGAEAQQHDQENILTCRSQTDCLACKSAQTDRSLTSAPFGGECNWFAEAGYCSAISEDAGADGEEAPPFCPGTPDGICYFAGSDCETCVQAQPDPSNSSAICSWSSWGDGDGYCGLGGDYGSATCDTSTVTNEGTPEVATESDSAADGSETDTAADGSEPSEGSTESDSAAVHRRVLSGSFIVLWSALMMLVV